MPRLALLACLLACCTGVHHGKVPWVERFVQAAVRQIHAGRHHCERHDVRVSVGWLLACLLAWVRACVRACVILVCRPIQPHGTAPHRHVRWQVHACTHARTHARTRARTQVLGVQQLHEFGEVLQGERWPPLGSRAVCPGIPMAGDRSCWGECGSCCFIVAVLVAIAC